MMNCNDYDIYKSKGKRRRTDIVNSGAFQSGIEEVELESCAINVHCTRVYTRNEQ
jgi:hypothetical protein